MKRLQVLLNLGEGLPPFREDEIVEVDDDLARMLIARRFAVELPGLSDATVVEPEAPAPEIVPTTPVGATPVQDPAPESGPATNDGKSLGSETSVIDGKSAESEAPTSTNLPGLPPEPSFGGNKRLSESRPQQHENMGNPGGNQSSQKKK